MWPRSVRPLSQAEELRQSKVRAEISREVDLRGTIQIARKDAGYLCSVIRASSLPCWKDVRLEAVKALYEVRIRARIAARALRLKRQTAEASAAG